MKKAMLTRAQELELRVISAAELYLEDPSATMRSIAKMNHTSKSTVYRDFRQRLPKIDLALSDKVAKKIDENIDERASRGGLAYARKCANRYRSERSDFWW